MDEIVRMKGARRSKGAHPLKFNAIFEGFGVIGKTRGMIIVVKDGMIGPSFFFFAKGKLHDILTDGKEGGVIVSNQEQLTYRGSVAFLDLFFDSAPGTERRKTVRGKAITTLIGIIDPDSMNRIKDRFRTTLVSAPSMVGWGAIDAAIAGIFGPVHAIRCIAGAITILADKFVVHGITHGACVTNGAVGCSVVTPFS
jgi:hypothetical protein